MTLGPHAAFIVTAWSVGLVVVAGLIAWIVFDHTALRRRLADLEEQGVTRRSQPMKDKP